VATGAFQLPEVPGIKIEGENKWLTLIQNAYLNVK
jgi:hypothetical protein